MRRILAAVAVAVAAFLGAFARYADDVNPWRGEDNEH